MSAKKKKVPAHDSNPVGYGRPPVHSRFRKGQSGNPTGKRRQSGADLVTALIRQEAYRLLTIREGDRVSRVPAVQAVLRSQVTAAAKGSIAAQRAILKAVQDIEAGARVRAGGGAGNKKLNKDVNEMTDKELMAIIKAAQSDKF